MNVLVTGGAGYLGSVLIPKLLARGHHVKVLDIGYFGISHLRVLSPAVDLIREDIRRIITDKKFEKELLRDVDCIVHLAAISNDPSAELYPKLTNGINVDGTQALALAARKKKIKFILSSSCSIYGEASKAVDENGYKNPLTVYAKSKVKSEQILQKLANKKWPTVILRNGTLFGYSPRMRFDLVVNIFSLCSTLYNEIKIFGKGKQWRPFLHVSDCARAMIHFIEKKDYQYPCYNIANENMTVVQLSKIFKQINPKLKITYVENQEPDLRNYCVLTERMHKEGFYPKVDIKMGAEEMIEGIITGRIQDPESIYYRNVKWLKELIHIGKKDHKDVVTFMESIAQTHLRR